MGTQLLFTALTALLLLGVIFLSLRALRRLVGASIFVAAGGTLTLAYAQDGTAGGLTPEQIAQLVRALAEHNPTAAHAVIAAMVAFGLKWFIDGLYALTNPRDWVKAATPLLAAVLGTGVGIFAYYGKGSSWIDAVIVGGSGPGAIVVNELGNMIRPLLRRLFSKPAPIASGTIETPKPPRSASGGFVTVGTLSDSALVVVLLTFVGACALLTGCECYQPANPKYTSPGCVVARQTLDCTLDAAKGEAAAGAALVVKLVNQGQVDTDGLLDALKGAGFSFGECIIAKVAQDFSAKPRASENEGRFLSNYGKWKRTQREGVIYTMPAPSGRPEGASGEVR